MQLKNDQTPRGWLGHFQIPISFKRTVTNNWGSKNKKKFGKKPHRSDFSALRVRLGSRRRFRSTWGKPESRLGNRLNKFRGSDRGPSPVRVWTTSGPRSRRTSRFVVTSSTRSSTLRNSRFWGRRNFRFEKSYPVWPRFLVEERRPKNELKLLKKLRKSFF